MKKKNVCFVLLAVLLFTILPTTGFAATDYKNPLKATAENCSIYMRQAAAKPGDTVTVELYVENNPGIQGATLTLTWDEGLTLANKAQNGTAFAALGLTAGKRLSSPYNLVWYAQDLEPEDIKDGVIATLEFAVSPQAQSGQRLSVNVSYYPGDILDCNKQTLAPIIENGYVLVEGEDHIHVFDQRLASEAYLAESATCTEAALYYVSCECGEKGTTTFRYGEPLGHSFVNGECVRCHIAETEAGEGCTVGVKGATAKPGDTVIVELYVENNPGIQGATFTVTWDPGLTLKKKAQNGAAFSALSFTAAKKLESPYNLVWYALDLEAEDIADGVIATLEFEVSAEAKDGDELNIGVSYVSGDVVDWERQAVDCRMLGAAIVVSDSTVQAEALQTENAVTIDITCKEAFPNAAIILAAYSEQGQMIDCRIQASNLLAEDNTVVFQGTAPGAEYRVFVLDNCHRPICAAVTAAK